MRVPSGLACEQPQYYRSCAELALLVGQAVMQASFDPPDEVAVLMGRELTELLASHSGNPAFEVISCGNETEQQPEMFGLSRADRRHPLLHTGLPTRIGHWFGVGGYLRPLSDVRTAGVRFAAECLAFSVPPPPSAVELHFGTAGHAPRWKAAVPQNRTAAWDCEDVRDGPCSTSTRTPSGGTIRIDISSWAGSPSRRP